MADAYGSDGLKVIAYPSEQFEFKGQEQGSNKDIRAMLNVLDIKGLTMMDKVDLNGDSCDEAIQYLKDYSELNGGNIRGNFTKFLIDKAGDVVAYYLPSARENSVTGDIERMIYA